MDATEYLNKPSLLLVSLDPTKAMFATVETSLRMEIELFIKTKEYHWRSIVSLLNISAIMKDIR